MTDTKSLSKVKIAARLRPDHSTDDIPQSVHISVNGLQQSISISDHGRAGSKPAGGEETDVHHFDEVFDPQATNQNVYYKTVSPLLEMVIDGDSATLLVLGARRAGKSYTLFGSEKEEGVVEYAMKYLFRALSAEPPGMKTNVSMMFYEVAAEKPLDLLRPSNTSLRLENDKRIGPRVFGSSKCRVQSWSNAKSVLDAGRRNRTVEKSSHTSHRGHCFIEVIIDRYIDPIALREIPSSQHSSIEPVTCRLMIVEIAASAPGTFDFRDSPAAPSTIRKGQSFQQRAGLEGALGLSSLTLSSVVRALSDPAQSMDVPFNGCMLTQILYSSLAGNHHLTALLTLSREYVDDHRRLLKITERMAGVKRFRTTPRNRDGSFDYDTQYRNMLVDLKREISIMSNVADEAEIQQPHKLEDQQQSFPDLCTTLVQNYTQRKTISAAQAAIDDELQSQSILLRRKIIENKRGEGLQGNYSVQASTELRAIEQQLQNTKSASEMQQKDLEEKEAELRSIRSKLPQHINVVRRSNIDPAVYPKLLESEIVELHRQVVLRDLLLEHVLEQVREHNLAIPLPPDLESQMAKRFIVPDTSVALLTPSHTIQQSRSKERIPKSIATERSVISQDIRSVSPDPVPVRMDGVHDQRRAISPDPASRQSVSHPSGPRAMAQRALSTERERRRATEMSSSRRSVGAAPGMGSKVRSSGFLNYKEDSLAGSSLRQSTPRRQEFLKEADRLSQRLNAYTNTAKPPSHREIVLDRAKENQRVDQSASSRESASSTVLSSSEMPEGIANAVTPIRPPRLMDHMVRRFSWNAPAWAVVRQATNLEDYYDLHETLGSGGFSVVRRGVDRITNKEYALKIVKNSVFKKNQKYIETEVQVIAGFDHPRLVKLREVIRTPEHFTMVTELMRGGELFHKILDVKKFQESQARDLTWQILEAIEVLHINGVLHRDLKPENVLLTKKGGLDIKLTDFGLAIFHTEDSIVSHLAGTPEYAAPEVLKHEPYSYPCDMWSIGVILYIMLCGFPPFYGPTPQDVIKKVKAGVYKFPKPHWDTISSSARDLVTRLLELDPAKRLTIRETRMHPWMRQGYENMPASLNEDPEMAAKLVLAQHKGLGKVTRLSDTSQSGRAIYPEDKKTHSKVKPVSRRSMSARLGSLGGTWSKKREGWTPATSNDHTPPPHVTANERANEQQSSASDSREHKEGSVRRDQTAMRKARQSAPAAPVGLRKNVESSQDRMRTNSPIRLAQRLLRKRD